MPSLPAYAKVDSSRRETHINQQMSFPSCHFTELILGFKCGCDLVILLRRGSVRNMAVQRLSTRIERKGNVSSGCCAHVLLTCCASLASNSIIKGCCCCVCIPVISYLSGGCSGVFFVGSSWNEAGYVDIGRDSVAGNSALKVAPKAGFVEAPLASSPGRIGW